MDKETKREVFMTYAKAIKELGYKVYVNKDYTFGNYGYIINDNEEIGYFQTDNFSIGITFSTVHKPCTGFGTGFGLDDEWNGHRVMTRELVDRSFMHHPEWAEHYSGNCNPQYLSQIKKWNVSEFWENSFHLREKYIEVC